ncbi:hypothetical protein Kpol_2002p98 [Vanderwaltozyma polyspora DSM 70294]|uniref:sterol esterase n=1 Tax=Vanderwaltozyma polyspora (strain ATCC 22028 / DSM 70294 / BCRC 21397 / CBS 2163 / NBRC 10782 / NRRL Y-8283 / UCD 57-17) TaxID=436907 RepID=A7TFL2_VANPO|nr:uncharacterized protein Kpol_2002p98 [Vanderwaltozyma polyspora DSM 70294]EDO19026.1 hypothetical protein Kpol_2002p98 [Vanderwaltozyma polyspora DSM 70294]
MVIVEFYKNCYRKLLRPVLPIKLRSFLKDVISIMVINFFLTFLLMFALWTNFSTHLHKRLDFRDTRSSFTKILPKIASTIKRKTLSYSGAKYAEPEQEILLSLDGDEVNNIEYDRTITHIEAKPSSSDDLVNYKNLNDDNVDEDDSSNWESKVIKTKISVKHTHAYDNYLEDSKLVCDLGYYYRQYGIGFEEIEVETDDGFIIDLWHLKPQNNNNKAGHPILLLHGLLQSSGSFATSGKRSLAYYLYQQGFDVWLGNNRCGFNPKWNMKKLNHDKSKQWDWDIFDMVKYDLKALIQTILNRTGYEKLSLIGHSQGTTQGFMGLVNGEDIYKNDDSTTESGDEFKLIDKLENFVALAPAVYPGPLLDEKMFVQLIRMGIDKPRIFRERSFVPIMMFMRLYVEQNLFAYLSYVMFNYLFDWNDALWDNSLRNRHFMFSPVHVSVKLMQWWLSPDPAKRSFKETAQELFPDKKAWFPLSTERPVSQPNSIHKNKPRETGQNYPNILMFVPRQDRLVDGERLINHFINHEPHSTYKIWYIDEYSHMDVLWANDMIERIGKPIVKNLRFSDNN